MTVHLMKFAVGCDSIATLARRQQPWTSVLAQGQPVYRHRTRFLPKRCADVLEGGSLYWVIKGQMLARQAVLGFETAGEGEDAHVLIQLDPEIVPVSPTPRRAFQGWRYLEPDDAPADLSAGTSAAIADMPRALLAQLRALALL